MPQAGVSVPRGKTRRGDRWSDDLELEFPARRGRRTPTRDDAPVRDGARVRRPVRPAAEPDWGEPVLQDDPYDLSLDLTPLEQRRTRPDSRPARQAPPVSEAPPVSAAPAVSDAPGASAAAAGRRTVTIHGRPSDRYRPPSDLRRRQPPPHYRSGFQPDRVAMWAVCLGLVLLLVAATSSHAAVLSAHTLANLAAH